MTTHTLRYYERVGLIQPVGRASNGHRRYSLADEAWIEFLHCLRATNMPIRVMQRFAQLRQSGEHGAVDRRKILEDHQAEIASQIVELQRAHRILEHKIASYRKMEQSPRPGVPASARVESANRLATTA